MAKGKVPAAAAKPAVKSFVKGGEKKEFKTEKKHLFRSDKRDFRIGRDILPSVDVTRFVRWPRYVRVQRQRAIIKKRLKVPPSINQFTKTLPASQAATLFRMLSQYRPETAKEKKDRLLKAAKDEVKEKEQDPAKKPKVIKFGLNHVTELIENKKAKLVVIAHDVDPVELVVWLPQLCRKMDIPYVIVKGKARLGALVHQKTAAALALTEVRPAHVHELENFIKAVRPSFNDNVDVLKKWGGGIMGSKANARSRIAERAAKKAATVKAQ